MLPSLLIDDLRHFLPGHNRTVQGTLLARNSADGLTALSRFEEFDEVWLDHDLGGQDTIVPVIDMMAGSQFNPAYYGRLRVRKVFVHTSNVVGRDMMVKVLRRAGFSVVAVQASDHFFVPESF